MAAFLYTQITQIKQINTYAGQLSGLLPFRSVGELPKLKSA